MTLRFSPTWVGLLLKLSLISCHFAFLCLSFLISKTGMKEELSHRTPPWGFSENLCEVFSTAPCTNNSSPAGRQYDCDTYCCFTRTTFQLSKMVSDPLCCCEDQREHWASQALSSHGAIKRAPASSLLPVGCNLPKQPSSLSSTVPCEQKEFPWPSSQKCVLPWLGPVTRVKSKFTPLKFLLQMWTALSTAMVTLL